MSYSLWNTDSKTISPLYWPFPDESSVFDSGLKSVRNVVIDREVLRKQCWPSCVVLVTLYETTARNETRMTDNRDIKIMASNNQIEIPEKTRIEMTLKTGEERDLIVDLKYAMSREKITFYNTRLFGNYVVFVDLYSETKNRCPLDGREVSDFVLTSG